MESTLIPNCNAEGQLYWSYIWLEKHYHWFTSCHNNVIWYVLNSCLIFFNISVSRSLASKIDQWQWTMCSMERPLFGSLKSLLLRGFCTLFLCWEYFWQGVNAQIAVLVTMEKLSHRKALFSEDGQTLNLPNFLLICSSEVHFVPVVFRLRVSFDLYMLPFSLCDL